MSVGGAVRGLLNFLVKLVTFIPKSIIAAAASKLIKAEALAAQAEQNGKDLAAINAAKAELAQAQQEFAAEQAKAQKAAPEEDQPANQDNNLTLSGTAPEPETEEEKQRRLADAALNNKPPEVIRGLKADDKTAAPVTNGVAAANNNSAVTNAHTAAMNPAAPANQAPATTASTATAPQQRNNAVARGPA